MTAHLAALAGAVDATRFHSSTVFSWFGKRIPQLPARIRRALDEAAAREYLLGVLQGQLYTDFYCRGGAKPTPAVAGGRLVRHGGAFVSALSSANAGTGHWEGGWEVVAAGARLLVAEKRGLRVSAEPRDVSATGGERIVAGARVALRMPKELRNVSPGYYLALGDEPLEAAPDNGVIRFYWNLTPEAAVPFIAGVTESLNGVGLAFQAKVVADPSVYTRCDAGVLYVRRSDYAVAAREVSRVHRRLALALRPTTPALTKQLAPGLGLAEQPAKGESFGLHRCGVLADGLIRAHERERTRPGDRLDAVVAWFAEEGVDVEAPFLNAGSSDVYEYDGDGAVR